MNKTPESAEMVSAVLNRAWWMMRSGSPTALRSRSASATSWCPAEICTCFCATLGQFVVHKGVDLAAFADSRAIAIPMPFARAIREDDARRLTGVDHVFDLQIRDTPFDDHFGGQVVAVRDIGRFDTRHRRAFDHVGRVGQRAPDHGFLHAIRGKNRPFLDVDRVWREGRFKLAYIISN